MKPFVALLLLGGIIIGIAIAMYFIYKSSGKRTKDGRLIGSEKECVLDANGTYGTLSECAKVNKKFDANWPHNKEWYFASGDDHRTSLYRFKDNIRFVVRRGFDFIIMSNKTDDLSKVSVTINSGPNNVKLVLGVAAGNFMVFRTDVTSPIGSAIINIANGSEITQLPVYVVFNPYHKDDPVYMPEKEMINEYVLNEKGYVFQGGSTENCSGRVWDYAQFSEELIVGTMGLMEEMYRKYSDLTGDEYLPAVDMSSPIDVSRYLSSAGNAIVLTGNWSKDLSKQVQDRKKKGDKYVRAPWEWDGSDAIFQQYLARKDLKNTQFPVVDFGQCWVFGGILNSMCRTIGIPCRHITNFSSAHPDCPIIAGTEISVCNYDQANFTNVMFDKKEEPSGNYFNGMVWNFHSWNDAWMKRPDLPTPYSGWQAIDATLQEKSIGIGRMGPAPLFAVKTMNPMVNYDSSFVIAEVNWIIELNDKDATKLPGSGTPVSSAPNIKEYLDVRPNNIDKDNEDWENYYKDLKPVSEVLEFLTSDYKPDKPLAAVRPLDLKHPGIKSSIPRAGVADKVPISVQIYPAKDETVTVSVSGILTQYTSEPMSGILFREDKQVQMKAGEPQVVMFYLDASQIDVSLANYLKFTIKAVIGGTEYIDSNSTYLEGPAISLVQNGSAVDVEYTNPYLDKPLTGVQLELSPQYGNRDVIDVGYIEPGKTYKITRPISVVKPVQAGDITFIRVNANITCNEIGVGSKSSLANFTI